MSNQPDPVHRRRRTARRVFAIAAIIYAAVLGSYLLLRILAALGLPVSDADPNLLGMWSAVCSSLMPAVLVPALPLVIVAALLRLPWVALALAPIGLAFLVLYGDLLLPPSPSATTNDTAEIVVFTHNLHVMTEGLDAVAEGIRASGADVVALQELSAPAAEFLGAALADLYPYQELQPSGVTTYGGGILSRWPLSDVQAWETTMLQLRATVERPEGAFAFYSLHPPPPHWFLRPFDASARGAALDEALRRAETETLPVVMAGDFNLTDQTTDYGEITGAGFQDSFRAAGWGLGLTFADFGDIFRPLSLLPPFIRIDYVFADPTFVPIGATVGAAAGSDHYPVRAVLVPATP